MSLASHHFSSHFSSLHFSSLHFMQHIKYSKHIVCFCSLLYTSFSDIMTYHYRSHFTLFIYSNLSFLISLQHEERTDHNRHHNNQPTARNANAANPCHGAARRQLLAGGVGLGGAGGVG